MRDEEDDDKTGLPDKFDGVWGGECLSLNDDCDGKAGRMAWNLDGVTQWLAPLELHLLLSDDTELNLSKSAEVLEIFLFCSYCSI